MINEHLNEETKYDQQIGTETSGTSSFKCEDRIRISSSKAKHPLLTNLNTRERNKFFGSLPNHLDSDETYRENSKSLNDSFFYKTI